MKTNLKTFLTITALAFLATACGNNANQNEQQESNEQTGKEQSEGLVSLTALQREAIGLEIGALQYRNLTGTIQATGELKLPPQSEADISAIIGGNVSRINIIEGDTVQQGQTLALLEHPDFIEMQVELQQNNNRLTYLEQEYERQQNLVEQGVGSGRTFQETQADYSSVTARVAGLKAKLRMLKLDVDKIIEGEIYNVIPVTAPISGFVKSVDIKIGEYVTPGDLLIEVVDNSHIHADLMVFEKDVYKVKVGQEVYLSISSAPNREYKATIFTIGKNFEENPKAVHIHAEIAGETDGLLPGMYVEGRIAADTTTTLAVPAAALVRDGDKSYIFIKSAETGHQENAGENSDHESEPVSENDSESWVFKRIPVSTGVQDNGWVGINLFEPLPDTVQIAYNGAYELISEMGKSETGDGH